MLYWNFGSNVRTTAAICALEAALLGSLLTTTFGSPARAEDQCAPVRLAPGKTTVTATSDILPAAGITTKISCSSAACGIDIEFGAEIIKKITTESKGELKVCYNEYSMVTRSSDICRGDFGHLRVSLFQDVEEKTVGFLDIEVEWFDNGSDRGRQCLTKVTRADEVHGGLPRNPVSSEFFGNFLVTLYEVDGFAF
jgi:hypothetical protein